MKSLVPWLGCGSAFYPEQWPEEMWDAYLAQIRDAGIAYLRLFEFAWGALEPEMDRFDWGWADRFLDKLDALGIRYILGTPAAGAPRWLLRTHPEVHVVSPGVAGEVANRRNCCPSQPAFRRRVSIIQRAMAERWGQRQGLIGWQIDNEMGHPECRCQRCRERFVDWLKARFVTPERLTQVCGLTMWSHQLRHWEDLDIPTESHNPALRHLFRTWDSEKWIEFADSCRTELIRDRALPAVVNMMAPWHGYDHFRMAEKMDVVGVDYYPFGSEGGAYNYTTTDFDLMMGYTRAIGRGRPFWILETQAGGAGRFSPPPGAILDWSLRMLAHGANSVTFFRWDTPNVGGEQLQYGVVGPGLHKDRIYEEVKTVAQRIRSLRPLLEESEPERAAVGIYFNYTSWWKDLDQWDGVKGSEKRDAIHNYIFLVRRHFEALAALGLRTDLCGPADDLSHYRLLVAPHLCSLSVEEARTLRAWAARGGTLLLAEPGFTHDEIGVGYLAPYPGPECLRQSAGAHHGVGGRLLPGCRPTVRFGEQNVGKVVQWAEQLEIDDPSVKILAGYGDAAVYAAWPALTLRHCGKGQTALLGCMLDDYAELYRRFIASAGLTLPVTPPGWWARTRRHADGRRVVFQKNMTTQVATLNLEQPAVAEDGSTVTSLSFQPGEIKIFSQQGKRRN
ncbi:MAG: beta-galactosidase [Kiritimatiellae bacterium]|nr:beta-galactosidase [Kiritimatiellia bacterium]